MAPSRGQAADRETPGGISDPAPLAAIGQTQLGQHSRGEYRSRRQRGRQSEGAIQHRRWGSGSINVVRESFDDFNAFALVRGIIK